MNGTTLYNRIFKLTFESCIRTNQYASEGDANRNRTNYGSATAYGVVLRELGHEVDIPVWDDNGFLRIPYLRVNEKKFEF